MNQDDLHLPQTPGVITPDERALVALVQHAAAYDALGTVKALQIMRVLARHTAFTLNAQELMARCHMRQSNVSYHMVRLESVGLVDGLSSGLYRHYSARKQTLVELRDGLLVPGQGLVSPQYGETIEASDENVLEAVRALSSPHRLFIVELLRRNPPGALRTLELADNHLHLKQPAVTQHLTILGDAYIVHRHRRQAGRRAPAQPASGWSAAPLQLVRRADRGNRPAGLTARQRPGSGR